MIADADTHLSMTEKNAQSVESLIRNMDKAGIDKSLVWLQPPYMRDIETANRYVYESASRYPDRLIPFGWVDPNFGLEASMASVRRYLQQYGMLGVKLNGAQNSFYIDDLETVDPLIGEIERQGSVLALHIGADYYEFTHPFRAAKIAKRHPGLRILIVHMGGAGIPDMSDASIEFAKECPNMMLVGSAIAYTKVLKAIRELGTKRVCFGSDAPFGLQHVELAAYRALLDGEVTEAEKQDILGGNLLRFLRLDLPQHKA